MGGIRGRRGRAVFVCSLAALAAIAGCDVLEPSAGTSVQIAQGAAVLAEPGDTVRLSASVLDARGRPAPGAVVRWTSADATVVRVAASGLVVALAPGSAAVTAAAPSGASAVVIVTVGSDSKVADRAALTVLYEATDGPNWTRNDNWLTDAPLGYWYGVETDSIGRVTGLELEYNDLKGEIPAELGNLSSLKVLWLWDNYDLTGKVPPELGNLTSLEELYLSGNGLTGKIPPELGSLARLKTLLLSNHDLTGGIPPELGNLTSLEELDLSGNGLTGELPVELGNLGVLRWLDLSDNGLTGMFPAELTYLGNLTAFYWSANAGLCAPGTRQFIDFVEGILDAGGPFCHEVDIAVLESLYNSAGGQNWGSSDGWLETGLLSDWHGVGTDSVAGRVVALDLSGNGLSGALPWSLWKLKGLRELRVDGNTELGGRLALGMTGLSLQALRYDGTSLCAPAEPSFRRWLQSIASHVGNGVECPPLTDRDVLEILYHAVGGQNWVRQDNWLTDRPLGRWQGVDTDESGRVVELSLHENYLTGDIPAELGNLASLERLSLYNNGLTGDIPAELGNLASLEVLWLYNNGLTGGIPPELGNLANLSTLDLSDNDLAGKIPPELTDLRLTELLLDGTGLCARRDNVAIQSWLRSIPRRRVSVCVERAEGEARAAAYVVQAVQSLAFPVPLVAGRPGLLRVFASAPEAGDARVPAARVTFYQQDGSERTIEVPSGNGTLEADLQEGSLDASANVEVPGDVLRPGVEMVVEVDPAGVLDPGLGVPARIPAVGRTALEVYELPPFDVTVVPFLEEAFTDSSILDITRGMTSDDPLFEATQMLLPVGAMSVTVHESVWISWPSSHKVSSLLSDTEAIRTLENGGGYWMGTLPDVFAGPGEAFVPGRSQFSEPDPYVIARGFGHNFYLWDAPCDATRPDPAFPNRYGLVGAWGWDRRSGTLVPPGWRDLMGDCDPYWIGDYHFAKAFRWRMHHEAGVAAFQGPPTQVLLVWGGTDAVGTPFLNPSFVVDDARASLPDEAGEWRIVGEAEDGRALFDRSFEMKEMTDTFGRQSFVFTLPTEAGWADALVRIVLAGPGGTAELDAESGPAAALLLDPGTGRVRGILRDSLRDWSGALPEPGLEVQVSRGVPAPDAWRR